LKKSKIIYFTKQTLHLVNCKSINFWSSTPTIIPHPDNLSNYLLNIRWNNYHCLEDGTRIWPEGGKNGNPGTWISINSRMTLDYDFNKISDEIFLEENFFEGIKMKYNGLGIEDIRMFIFKGKIYFNGTTFDPSDITTVTTAGEMNYDVNKKYILERNIIHPNFVPKKQTDKNWSYFNYHDQLALVYQWYPLQICAIDFENSTLKIIDNKYSLPDYFKNARGSTTGCTFDQQIWFICHRTFDNGPINNQKTKYDYVHFFAIFNADMELIKYSETFKFDGDKIEYCLGLIVEENRIIISYSNRDCTSKIGIYSHDSLEQLRWYKS
jgi:hypothetical protein